MALVKLRWHFLWSLVLAGVGFAVAHELNASDAVALGVAAFLFVLYWLVVMGRGGDIDPGDFFG